MYTQYTFHCIMFGDVVCECVHIFFYVWMSMMDKSRLRIKKKSDSIKKNNTNNTAAAATQYFILLIWCFWCLSHGWWNRFHSAAIQFHRKRQKTEAHHWNIRIKKQNAKVMKVKDTWMEWERREIVRMCVCGGEVQELYWKRDFLITGSVFVIIRTWKCDCECENCNIVTCCVPRSGCKFMYNRVHQRQRNHHDDDDDNNSSSSRLMVVCWCWWFWWLWWWRTEARREYTPSFHFDKDNTFVNKSILYTHTNRHEKMASIQMMTRRRTIEENRVRERTATKIPTKSKDESKWILRDAKSKD